MKVAQHEVLGGRIFKSDTSRTGRSNTTFGHERSIVPGRDGSVLSFPFPAINCWATFYRPFRDGSVFPLDSRHFVPGYFHSVPSGTGACFLSIPGNFVPGYFHSVPSGTGASFLSIPGNFVPGYFHSVPSGTGACFLPIPGTSYRATFTVSLRDSR